MITISLRFEEEMKKELDDMCDEMGMNLTTFFMIYAKKVLRDRRIPFDIAAPSIVLDDESGGFGLRDDMDDYIDDYDSGPPGRKKSASAVRKKVTKQTNTGRAVKTKRVGKNNN